MRDNQNNLHSGEDIGMTAFSKIKRGLEEALAYSNGERDEFRVHEVHPVDVRTTREKLGMTQAQFSTTFGFPLDTLRKWEASKRRPTGASRTLLRVIEHNPAAVAEALER